MNDSTKQNTPTYTGARPWAGLGTELVDLPNLMTSEEAIQAANLDWKVEVVPAFAKLPETPSTPALNEIVQIPGHFSTVRMDTKQPLGVVGRIYTPVQNREAFEFFDSVVQDGRARYDVVGAFGAGETIWILAKLLSDDIRIGDSDDVIKRYLLMTNSHNGLASLKMFYTPIREVCTNTLSLARTKKAIRQGISIRHFPNIAKRIEKAKEVLGFAEDFYKEIGEVFNALNTIQMTGKGFEKYVNRVFNTADPKQAPSTRLINQRKQVMDLIDVPENSLPRIKGSYWAAYNTVTMYVDHFRNVPKTDRFPSRKLDSIWIGSGAQLKERALSIALEEAGLPGFSGASLN